MTQSLLLCSCKHSHCDWVLDIVNTSLTSCLLSDPFKCAEVRTLLKKYPLDNTILAILNNFRPISTQFFKLLNSYKTMTFSEKFQSGFRALHSTATTLLKVFNELRLNIDANKTSILVLLDQSAAFDIIDHQVLLQCVEALGFSGTVLYWFNQTEAFRLN